MDLERSARTLTDPDAPSFHLSAPYGRINDPNGLIVVDGVAHAFYQWGPSFPDRAGIGWGHASSSDLIRWTHHGMAFEPDADYDRDGCYSGSAIAADTGADFLYTGNVKHPDGTREAHQVHVHTDDFVTFTKNVDGPVVPDAARPPGYTAHFRDPMVYACDGGRLRMCIGVQRTDETGAVLLYSAESAAGPWRFDGELAVGGLDAASAGYMWECPNIFRLTDEETGIEHDVLVICPQGATDPAINPFGVADVCGYVVGRLDGTHLRDTTGFRLLDAGFEFYAPQVFAGRDTTRDALLLSWAGMPAEDDQPSRAHDWVHTLSAPRRLTLRGGVLHQAPAVDRADFGVTIPLDSAALEADESLALPVPGDARTSWLTLRVRIADGAQARLRIGPDAAPLTVDLDADALTVDRSATRYVDGGARREVALPAPAGAVRTIDLLIDRSVVEVIVDGTVAFTARAFFAPGPVAVTLKAVGGGVTLVEGESSAFSAH
ncbi:MULTISPECIES: GH32 C-terminal domain-containing protein [Microbacterium]|uniref:glycoside hydrolase family 32 protein n=1 Tax=Microbacterium TaxID=33882 RepID=UPI002784B33E|nr:MULTISPECIES: GH32 C-terminal domain-containing protein [Microbacterium]MDQ1074182.1 beta-fructofuranosidase [Microbacterium sp. SORGH_AS_0969]MDQ1114408.1 beta-fructofuranosidase [Microbacterium testaceum]